MSTKTPDYLTFECPLSIQAAAPESNQKLPRFAMVAYTGAPMRVSAFFDPTVIDLAGLNIERQAIPVRLSHNANYGVGHTERIAVEGGQLVAEGVISRNTSWAKDVATSAANGFPWRASVGTSIERVEQVEAGVQAEVNGRIVTGPVEIVRQGTLKEISFVDVPADSGTSATVTAHTLHKETRTMSDQNTDTAATDTTDAGSNATDAHSEHKMEAGGDGKDAPAIDVDHDGDDLHAHMPEPAWQRPSQDRSRRVEASASGNDDPIIAMRQRVAAETRRIAAIEKLCQGKFPGVQAKAIEEGWTETETELAVLRASRPRIPHVASGSASQPRDTEPRVFEAVALMAAGMTGSRMEALYAEAVLEAADKFRGVGIQEFCELASGQQLPRFRRDASGWLEAAFSTASLPGILSNVANKMLLDGYNYVEDAWRQIARIASVNDFKEHSRYRMTGSFTFEQVAPDGELKHGKLDEQKYGQKADTHGIMFSLTRQMIINDDMGAFTDIPRQIGMGAAESIADAVWGLWLKNPTQSDGKAFFSTDHNNYASGATTALGVDSLTDAEVKFGGQTKPNGRPLGLPAALLLVPTALKVPAQQLMTSVLLNETTTANKGKPANNPHVGKFGVVSSTYLSNASFSGYSSKAWYLLADPNRLPAIEIAFLNGVDRPTVEKTDADFNTLGVQFRGYIDFGVREQEFRAALMMKGE